MDIQSLGYLGLGATEPEKWAAFARDVLGAPAGPGHADGVQYVRMDDRHHRIAIVPGEDRTLAYAGLELPNKRAFNDALDELNANGVQFTRGTDDECRDRYVDAFVGFTDPAGHAIELFYGAFVPPEPFAPTTDISGFDGLGHIVLGAADLAAAEAFYTDVLNLKVSDYATYPRGDITANATFMHAADGRHHCVALADFTEGAHHMMIEVPLLDDVGKTMDICERTGAQLTRRLGRHSNDKMVSFYVAAPNNIVIEYGYDGIWIDDTNWQVTRQSTVSIWGHELLDEPT